jgi:multidrug resistance efflux pump
MASLTARAAETTAKQAEIAIRLEVADALMKSAHERLAQAEEQLTKITASRFVSDAFVVNVSKERYAALQEKASRQAERKASLEQLEQLRRSQAEARQALENLRVMYNDGRIRAPSDGIVGPEVAVQGGVIKHGDHLMHVYVGRKYAIVYLETGTLYATAVGDRVAVADGFSESGGTVTEILPLSMPLPSEFQKAFRAPTRGQIAKIALDDETVFPLSSKIVITGRGALPSIDDVSRSLKTAAAALRTAWQRSFGTSEAAGAGR